MKFDYIWRIINKLIGLLNKRAVQMENFIDVSGIGLVVDEAVFLQEDNNIKKIVKEIEDNGILLLKYDKIPDDKIIKSLQNLSFIILDWLIFLPEDPMIEENGIKRPQAPDIVYKRTIEFVKKVKDNFLGPVFILSDEVEDKIKEILINEGLTKENGSNFVFVKSKSDVLIWNDFKRIFNEEVNNAPSMYTLLKFNSSLNKSKKEAFNDLQKNRIDWASLLYCSAKNDNHGEASKDVLNTVMKNIESRMIKSFVLDDKIMIKNYTINNNGEYVFSNLEEEEKNEAKKIFSSLIFLPNDKLNDNDIDTGDMFYNNGIYYLNIRRSCSLRFNEKTKTSDMYCLAGSKPKSYKKEETSKKDLEQKELNVSHIKLDPIDVSGSIKELQFNFGNLHTICVTNKNGNLKFELIGKDNTKTNIARIGRILHPYITDICVRYSSYFHNPGLPRYPI